MTMTQEDNNNKKKPANSIKCDQCGKIFFADDIKLERAPCTIYLGPSIVEPEETFFACPYCKSKYLINIHDQHIKIELSRLNAMQVQFRNQSRAKAPKKQLTELYDEIVAGYANVHAYEKKLKEAVLNASIEYGNKLPRHTSEPGEKETTDAD